MLGLVERFFGFLSRSLCRLDVAEHALQSSLVVCLLLGNGFAHALDIFGVQHFLEVLRRSALCYRFCFWEQRGLLCACLLQTLRGSAGTSRALPPFFLRLNHVTQFTYRILVWQVALHNALHLLTGQQYELLVGRIGQRIT